MSVFGIDIAESAICILEDGLSKHQALDRVITAICRSPDITDPGAFRRAVYERESVQSTGIGGGVAIPHVRIEQVVRPVLGFGLSEKGIPFDSLDNEPVHIIVLFAMPSGSQRKYLDLLAQVMVALKTPGFRQRLLTCNTPVEAVAFLNTQTL